MSKLPKAPPRTEDNWIQTSGGKKFWPLNPRKGDVDIHDIAHALSNECRYNGHCSSFYSVAQHSVLLSIAMAGKGLARAALLHDASEAYLKDLPRPVKRDKTIRAAYAAAEDRLMRCIASALDVPWSAIQDPRVSEYDHAILTPEMTALMSFKEPRINNGLLSAMRITPWPPRLAEYRFLAAWHGIAGPHPAKSPEDCLECRRRGVTKRAVLTSMADQLAITAANLGI